MTDDVRDLWCDAARFDASVTPMKRHLDVLRKKRVIPRPYSREALFEAMAAGRPAVLRGVSVPVRGARGDVEEAVIAAVERAFTRGETARVQLGPSRRRGRLPIAELVRRWREDRRLVSITDLHTRTTSLDAALDTRELSAFNLLPVGSDEMRRQEMMTMVIATRGNVTDAHSDDPDGSNHCFTGRKLWIAWETFAGLRAGLEDCERVEVFERAHFDLDRFCALPSACWWTVGPGETLFLPGGLTHKVITLERYLGIGSFYVAPASGLDSLSRWYLFGPLWGLDSDPVDLELVDEIAERLRRRIHTLARGSRELQRRWGFDYVAAAIATWQRRWTRTQRRTLLRRAPFERLMAEMTAPSLARLEAP